MFLLNLLSTEINVYKGGFGDVKLNGITKAIQFIIEQPKLYSVAVGIILFTLALKLITLPFDIISRASTKKNALKMEKMRPELERLQRQYANNKDLYQKKMMALYKKEGYSQFSACLPSLLTIVFFFIVISGFNTYSRFAQKKVFNEMAISYTQEVEDLALTSDNGYVIFDEDSGKYYLDKTENGNYNKWIKENASFITFVSCDEKGTTATYNVTDVSAMHEYIKQYAGFQIDELGDEYFNEEFTEIKSGKETAVITAFEEELAYLYVKNNVCTIASQKAAETYRENVNTFMITGTKNIWVPDVAWKHPITGWTDFKSALNKDCVSTVENNTLDEQAYNMITASLDEEKNKANGYFVLVVLSIVVMLLSQIVATKSQKTQMELQSVDGADGQAAQTQKMMTWMMPLMFGIFAFVYTASFSIYMIISSLASTISTLLINYFVELKFKKDMERLEQEKLRKRYGRSVDNKEQK